MTEPNSGTPGSSPGSQTIVLGGGCFWCVEAVFAKLEGVQAIQSGYTGGHVERPTYAQVCEANTGHVEVAAVTFDPAHLSLEDIFNVFFATHDPTTVDRQGNDVGPQYASAIFWSDENQRAAAQAFIDKLEQDQVFGSPIVTQVRKLEKFWPAEDYHRDYFARNPNQGYCQVVIAPKVAKMRENFAAKLKKS